MAGYKFTKEEITQEFLKCGRDPLYFINNYAKISHPIRGKIAFKTYEYQDALVEDFQDHRFIIVLKARQLGITTITAGYIAWLMLFYKDKNVVVIATKFSTATTLVRKVKSIVKNIPVWMRGKIKVKVDNRSSFELSNGSEIKAVSTSVDAGRSEAISLLVIDEAAHVAGFDELWTGLYSTLSTGGSCIALSTPKGVGNWFHEKWAGAILGQNDFYPVKLLWDVHPERDQEWFDHETRNMSKRQLAQELLCGFNASGDTVMQTEDLERIKLTVKDPKIRTGIDRNFWIWETAQENETYLLSADTARGDGKDYSTFHIFKLSTLEIIAEYRGKIAADLFSVILQDTGRQYGNAMIVMENNTYAYGVLEKLFSGGYPNIYCSIKGSMEYVSRWEADRNPNAVLGIPTSSRTRPLMIAKLEEFIRNKQITIYSERFLSELETFIWRNGKPEGMRGYNDDLVLAAAVGCWGRETAVVESSKSLAYNKAVMGAIFKTSAYLDTTVPGMLKPRKLEEQDEKDYVRKYGGLMLG